MIEINDDWVYQDVSMAGKRSLVFLADCFLVRLPWPRPAGLFAYMRSDNNVRESTSIGLVDATS
jgi:hypothetical protein